MRNANKWLEKARSDLDMVDRAMMPELQQNLEQAAYHLQQAAEKSVKSLLEHMDIEYPRGGGRGHDINLSAARIPAGHRLGDIARSLGALTPWATAYRYPHDDPATAPSLPTSADIENWRAKVAYFVEEVSQYIIIHNHEDGDRLEPNYGN